VKVHGFGLILIFKKINMSNIYKNGIYLHNNPSLHQEDSEYKSFYICNLLEKINFKSKNIKILDVGGGAGLISKSVCSYLERKGFDLECHAFDLSEEMLLIQKKNNPYITFTSSNSTDFYCKNYYDVTLLIDVIEHIEEKDTFANFIDNITNYVVYNIPVEHNLADWLRNLFMLGKYYKKMTLAVGHIHFFSLFSAKKFVESHHRIQNWTFPNYYGHLLNSNHPNYVSQRKRIIRSVEFHISNLIYKYLKKLSPLLIHTSIFILASSRSFKNSK